jgi:hypothetical protein
MSQQIYISIIAEHNVKAANPNAIFSKILPNMAHSEKKLPDIRICMDQTAGFRCRQAAIRKLKKQDDPTAQGPLYTVSPCSPVLLYSFSGFYIHLTR